MILHENHENGDPPAPGRRNSMYYCTISHDMGSSFRWIPIIFMFFMKSTNFHEITINHKNVYFAVLVRNSMIYPKRACGYLWIRLYIVRSTASVAKGTTLGHENQKAHHFYGVSWFSWKSWFMENCEIHVKSTRKQPSAPEVKTAVIHMPFYMVRRPLGYFGSQNGEIHWSSLNLAGFHHLVKCG